MTLDKIAGNATSDLSNNSITPVSGGCPSILYLGGQNCGFIQGLGLIEWNHGHRSHGRQSCQTVSSDEE